MRHFIDAIDGSLVRNGITTIGEDRLFAIFVWAGLLNFAADEAKNSEPMLTNSLIWS